MGHLVLIDEDTRLAVLAPIDDSVGIDGREDEGAAGNLLREIRSQRKALVRLEQAAAMVDEDVVIPDGSWDWDTIGENAIEYLSTFGKDLEVAAVLIEVAARRKGLGDLAEATEAVADLVEAFWDQGLYPAEDEDGVETRFQPLSGLSGSSQSGDGALINPLRRNVILPSGLRMLDKVRGDSLMQSAQTLTGDSKRAKSDEARQAYADVEAAVRRSSPAGLAAAAALAARIELAWKRLIASISERTKPKYPSASRLNEELRTLNTWLAGLAPNDEAGGAPAGDGAATDDDGSFGLGSSGLGSAVGGGAGTAGFVSGRISRREDALKAVAAAAEYFQVHEPLSPIGTTLREVDRRARMSLHELLSELIPDDSARNDFYWRSGIRPPAPAEDDDSGN